MSLANRTLVIMAKAPRLGSVKTRLAESLSVQAVTELYRCLLNDTITLAQALDDVEIAIMCPASDVDDLSRAVAKTVRIVPQTGLGLAAGLASVFNHFATSGQQRVIAFNSDSPHLPASVLDTAFDVLRSEEHTSELQSQSNLVCRLLLEKKKQATCRRRSYAASDRRFTPVAESELAVVTPSVVTVSFSRAQVLRGVQRPCQGRPVVADAL